MVQPISRIQIESSRFDLEELRLVAVSEHHEVEVRIGRQEIFCERPEPLGAPVAPRVVGPAVPALGAADHSNQPGGPIGMQLPKRSACRPAPDHGLEGAVPPVAPPKPIAVRNVGTEPSHLRPYRSVQEFDSDFVPQESPAPRIVVASQQPNSDARVDQVRKDSQHGEVPTQDHGVILEPEVEKVAVDQQVIGDIRDPGEERHHGRLVDGRSRPQMGVGDDDAGPFHAAKYRVALTNVKRASIASFYLSRETT